VIFKRPGYVAAVDPLFDILSDVEKETKFVGVPLDEASSSGHSWVQAVAAGTETVELGSEHGKSRNMKQEVGPAEDIRHARGRLDSDRHSHSLLLRSPTTSV
jgi:hypothetical protein